MSYQWTTKDLDDLEQFYWAEIAPAMEADGRDPEHQQPPYAVACSPAQNSSARSVHALCNPHFPDNLLLEQVNPKPAVWMVELNCFPNPFE